MPQELWTLGADRRTATTPGNVDVGGTLTARSARVTGSMTVRGRLQADEFKGSIHYSQITGLLGDGFSLRFPDVANNLAEVEVAGIDTSGSRMVIITGPGYDIERIHGYRANGASDDNPGFTRAHSLIFEASGAAADALRDAFNHHVAHWDLGESRSISLLVKDRAGNEAFRWNLLEFVPVSCERSVDGRLRFRWDPNSPLKFPVYCASGDPFGDSISYNAASDKRVEIIGVTDFAPQVEHDKANRLLTMTFGVSEGKGVLPWVKSTVDGTSDKTALHLWTERNGRRDSQRDYFGCFPVRYEQFTGFGLSLKIQARVTISYDSSEDR